MQFTPDHAVEDLKAIIDKYENPELFSFLDYYENEMYSYGKGNNEPLTPNSIVVINDSELDEIGIVTDVNTNECIVNVFGETRNYPLASPALKKGETKTLPLEWARNNAWGDFLRFKLKTLSFFLYLAHNFDKIQSLSNSRTQILDHQIESTYKIVKSISPRFLIADEVGLGKTVEAGLIIKEFIIRHNYNRIMIVVPASLQYQWQQEMKEKFNENFTIIDSRTLLRLKNKLPDKVIVSLDFAKQERIRTIIVKKKWDTLIFDEAHKLRRDGVTKTLGYALAEEMSQKVSVLLLLSATPFSGKLEELYYLVRLLNPSLLGSINTFTLDFSGAKRDELKNRLSTVLIRRRKVDVGGFTRRFAKTISFEFTDEEQALYDRTTEYIRNEYNKALETRNNFHYFILTVYQKMLDSSSYAIVNTLSSRIQYLTKVLESNDAIDAEYTPVRKKLLEEDAGNESIDSEDPEEIEEVKVSMYPKEAIEEMKKELSSLKEILKLAEKITINKKGETLKLIVAKILKTEKSAKILIFTQFARTQEYLVNLLSEYKLSVFNGKMDKRAKDRAILEFQKQTNILICTEAGGEGRNLQFCHYLINYDLPWNPQKIEQRIGRLHRFGQAYDVKIYNFSTKDTIGARILDVLENKIKIFEDSIGATDTLLGYYEDEIDFNATFMKFHVDPTKVEEELDKKISKAKGNFKYLEELTAHKVLNFNLDEFYSATRKEREISNTFIQHMMEEYIRVGNSGLVIKKADQYPGLYRIHDEKTGDKINGVFDSRTAIEHPEHDFFAFGHRVIDEHSARMRELRFLGLTTISQMDCESVDESWEGVLFVFIVNFRGNRVSQYLIPVFIDKGGLIDTETENLVSAEFLRFGFREAQHFETEDYTAKLLDRLYKKANLSLEIKIKSKLDEVKKDIDKQIALTITSLNSHYNGIFSELDDLLQVQKSKEKIYNIKTMKSLIARTENKIKQFRSQQAMETERIKNVGFVRTSYSLLNLTLLKVN